MRVNLALAALVFSLLLPIGASNAQDIWQETLAVASTGGRGAGETALFVADIVALRLALEQAPAESSGDRSHRLPLPMPDGGIREFNVVDSPIMAPELAARYPDIRTFKVYAEDGRYAGRIGISPLGFHGLVDTGGGTVNIAPQDFRSPDPVYTAQYRHLAPREPFQCGAHRDPYHLHEELAARLGTANRVPGSLLQYRIAIAATFEYYSFFSPPSPANTTAAILATLSAVNAVYERDLGITFELAAVNDQLYETTDTGLLSNGDDFALLAEVNDWIDSRIGDGAYDIGHIFYRPTFGGGGVAFIGAACDNALKAGGVSGLPNPGIGKIFDIDLVAHEIGHQLGADHSFNGTSGSCFVGRNRGTAWEPGSGTTIMAYAGLCGNEDLQGESDVSFHASSIAQINAFTAGAGSCAAPVATVPANNADPVIASASADATIPASTPFILESNASDVETPLALKYQWDQMNSGCPTDSATFGTDNGSNALFRSYEPRAQGHRNFPALGTQLQGLFDKAEVLPCHDRALDFRVMVRDGSSGQDFEDVGVTVTSNAGPFRITNLNTAPEQTISAGVPIPVEWDVANTDLAPVNCTSVDIELLTFADGYASYSVYPLATTPNAGSASVTVNPGSSAHPRARIRVKCSDNIFYALSDADLTLEQTVNPPVPLADDAFTTRFSANDSLTGTVAPACGPVVDCTPPPVDNDTGGHRDATAIDPRWLLMLVGIAALVKRLRRYG